MKDDFSYEMIMFIIIHNVNYNYNVQIKHNQAHT